MSKQHQPEKSTTSKPNDQYRCELILHNDDINTFDHVIDSLVEICHHHPLQAEQCATLTHLKGQCEIMVGQYDELVSKKTELLNQGLIVTLSY